MSNEGGLPMVACPARLWIGWGRGDVTTLFGSIIRYAGRQPRQPFVRKYAGLQNRQTLVLRLRVDGLAI